MGEYVFHVLHNARPEYEMDVLDLLHDGRESSYDTLLTTGRELGLTIGHRVDSERLLRDILQPLRDLEFIEPRSVQLTSKGVILAKIAVANPDLLSEIIHYFYYSSWQSSRETEKCFSWSYRTVCNHLWSQGTASIDSALLASYVSTEASDRFAIESVSFSTRSVAGILLWLDALRPAVITYEQEESQGFFNRRTFCPPELLALSIDRAYQQVGSEYGINLLLNNAVRTLISQLCLIEPSSLERVLDYAVVQFDFLEKGIGGGWGHYLVLRRPVQLEDFLR